MDIENYKTTPIGSLLIRERAEELQYINELPNLPPGLSRIVLSPKTGSFIKGLGKTHNLIQETIPHLAFLVLQVCFGEKTTVDLPNEVALIASISKEKAQLVAQEIERELFAPVMLELNEYAQKKKSVTLPTVPHESGAPNVLDLKSQRPVPPPPPIPRQ